MSASARALDEQLSALEATARDGGLEAACSEPSCCAVLCSLLPSADESALDRLLRLIPLVARHAALANFALNVLLSLCACTSPLAPRCIDALLASPHLRSADPQLLAAALQHLFAAAHLDAVVRLLPFLPPAACHELVQRVPEALRQLVVDDHADDDRIRSWMSLLRLLAERSLMARPNDVFDSVATLLRRLLDQECNTMFDEVMIVVFSIAFACPQPQQHALRCIDDVYEHAALQSQQRWPAQSVLTCVRRWARETPVLLINSSTIVVVMSSLDRLHEQDADDAITTLQYVTQSARMLAALAFTALFDAVRRSRTSQLLLGVVKMLCSLLEQDTESFMTHHFLVQSDVVRLCADNLPDHNEALQKLLLQLVCELSSVLPEVVLQQLVVAPSAFLELAPALLDDRATRHTTEELLYRGLHNTNVVVATAFMRCTQACLTSPTTTWRRAAAVQHYLERFLASVSAPDDVKAQLFCDELLPSLLASAVPTDTNTDTDTILNIMFACLQRSASCRARWVEVRLSEALSNTLPATATLLRSLLWMSRLRWPPPSTNESEELLMPPVGDGALEFAPLVAAAARVAERLPHRAHLDLLAFIQGCLGAHKRNLVLLARVDGLLEHLLDWLRDAMLAPSDVDERHAPVVDVLGALLRYRPSTASLQRLLQLSRTAGAVDLFVRLLEPGPRLPFVQLEEGAALHCGMALRAGRDWPGTSGYSLMLWLRLQATASTDVHQQLLSIGGRTVPLLNLHVHKRRLHLKLGGKRAFVFDAAAAVLPEQRWFHLVLTHEYYRLKSSRVCLFVNGALVQSGRFAFPSFDAGVKHLSLYVGGASSCWRLGSVALGRGAIDASSVSNLYADGRGHLLFANCCQLYDGVSEAARVCSSVVASALSPSAAPRTERSTMKPLDLSVCWQAALVTTNACGEQSRFPSSGGGIDDDVVGEASGGVWAFAPLGLAAALTQVDGMIALVLPLIAKSASSSELKQALRVLLLCMRDSPALCEALLRRNRYQLLSLLVLEQARLLDKSGMELLGMLFGLCEGGHQGAIGNSWALRSLLIDQQVWNEAPQAAQQHVLQLLLNALCDNPNRDANVRVLHSMQATAWLLSVLGDDELSKDAGPAIIALLRELLAHSRANEFALVCESAVAAVQLHVQPTGELVKLRPHSVSATSRRIQLLEMLLAQLRASIDANNSACMQRIADAIDSTFVATLVYSSGDPQRRTAELALQLMSLLLLRVRDRSTFVDDACFGILPRLLVAFQRCREIYFLLLCMAGGRDFAQVSPTPSLAQLDVHSFVQAFAANPPQPKQLQQRVVVVEAVPVLLSLIVSTVPGVTRASSQRFSLDDIINPSQAKAASVSPDSPLRRKHNPTAFDFSATASASPPSVGKRRWSAESVAAAMSLSSHCDMDDLKPDPEPEPQQKDDISYSAFLVSLIGCVQTVFDESERMRAFMCSPHFLRQLSAAVFSCANTHEKSAAASSAAAAATFASTTTDSTDVKNCDMFHTQVSRALLRLLTHALVSALVSSSKTQAALLETVLNMSPVECTTFQRVAFQTSLLLGLCDGVLQRLDVIHDNHLIALAELLWQRVDHGFVLDGRLQIAERILNMLYEVTSVAVRKRLRHSVHRILLCILGGGSTVQDDELFRAERLLTQHALQLIGREGEDEFLELVAHPLGVHLIDPRSSSRVRHESAAFWRWLVQHRWAFVEQVFVLDSIDPVPGAVPTAIIDSFGNEFLHVDLLQDGFMLLVEAPPAVAAEQEENGVPRAFWRWMEQARPVLSLALDRALVDNWHRHDIKVQKERLKSVHEYSVSTLAQMELFEDSMADERERNRELEFAMLHTLEVVRSREIVRVLSRRQNVLESVRKLAIEWTEVSTKAENTHALRAAASGQGAEGGGGRRLVWLCEWRLDFTEGPFCLRTRMRRRLCSRSRSTSRERRTRRSVFSPASSWGLLTPLSVSPASSARLQNLSRGSISSTASKSSFQRFSVPSPASLLIPFESEHEQQHYQLPSPSLESLSRVQDQVGAEYDEWWLQAEHRLRILLDPDSEVLSFYSCKKLVGLDEISAVLALCADSLDLIVGYELDENGEIVASTAADLESAEAVPFKRTNVPLKDIGHVRKCRYLLQARGLEISFRDGGNCLLVLQTSDRDQVYNWILKMVPSLKLPSGSLIHVNDSVNVRSVLKSLTSQWQAGEISNFAYLMYLSLYSQRTFNDLTQYPVFPWVLSDYESAQLDLDDPNVFRDLSKPMGALSERRAEQFRQRFEAWDDANIPRFHYGAHYSSAGVVLNYLARLEPFTEQLRRLNGERFDRADRMFSDVGECWRQTTGLQTTDVRELIPEFYFSPYFLLNGNRLSLGRRQSGVEIGDVVLPPWAGGDAREFIRLHREALESAHVSANLHAWIDLIYGYKQEGDAAVEALNCFYYTSYEGKVDIDAIDDDVVKEATIEQIRSFGQTPRRLFSKPHPPRISLPCHGHLVLDANAIIVSSDWTASYAIGCVGRNPDGVVLAAPRSTLLLPPTLQRCVSWRSGDNSIRLFNISPDPLGQRLSGVVAASSSDVEGDSVLSGVHVGAVTCVATSSDGSVLVSGGEDAQISVFRRGSDGRSYAVSGYVHGHTSAITSLQLSPEFNVIMSASRNGRVLVWDLNRLECLAELCVQRDNAREAVVLALDGQARGDMAVARGSRIDVWDTNCVALASSVAVPPTEGVASGVITALVLVASESSGRRSLISGHGSGCLMLWLVQRDEARVWRIVPTHALPGAHSAPLSCIVAEPSRSRMWSGDSAGRLLEWRLDDWKRTERALQSAAQLLNLDVPSVVERPCDECQRLLKHEEMRHVCRRCQVLLCDGCELEHIRRSSRHRIMPLKPPDS